MQIDFFATKSNIIKLFSWISENVEDVVFLDFYTKKEFSLDDVLDEISSDITYGDSEKTLKELKSWIEKS